MHYIFVWHQDNYYSNAASGVVYDAINLGIPMIARHCSQISEWANSGIDVASSHENLASVIDWLAEITITSEAENYQRQYANESKIRDMLSIPKIAQSFLNITLPLIIT